MYHFYFSATMIDASTPTVTTAEASSHPRPPASPPKEDARQPVAAADLKKRDVSAVVNAGGATTITASVSGNDNHEAAAASSTKSNGGSSPKRRTKRRPLHVEAIVHPSCPTNLAVIQSEIKRHITTLGRKNMMYTAGKVDLRDASEIVRNGCLYVAVVDLDDFFEADDGGNGNNGNNGGIDSGAVGTWLVSSVIVHAYVLSDEEASAEELDNDDNDEELTACETLPLPHSTLHGLWDTIILPPGIKSNLLEYASSAILFSDRAVSPHVIGWNRVILLHGPPGTGKTSLCRALAHKLAVRLSDRFVNGGCLLEVHSHSLFSKWFSESGKLVSRLFDRIREMVEDDPDSLVCVLVDEVESLAAARSAGTGGGAGEPSDAVRAVNSLLTSIDRLRQYGNVVVMTTSNITGSVDVAFVDRADVKQYVGLPILEARYEILRSCVLELIRVGIVRVEEEGEDGDGGGDSDMEIAGSDDSDKENAIRGAEKIMEAAMMTLLPPHRQLRRLHSTGSLSSEASSLVRCAELADGMSGRSLRKLPFQSHALFVRTADPVSLDDFLEALRGGVQKEQDSRKAMKKDSGEKGECTCGANKKS